MALRRGTVTLAAVVAGLALLTSCTGSDSGKGSDGSGGSKAKTPSKEQLLGKAELPTGAKLSYIGLSQFVKRNVTQLANAKTQPAECAGLVKALFDGQNSKGAVVAAEVSAGQIVEVLTEAKGDPIGPLKTVVQRCSQVRSSAAGQQAASQYEKFDTSGVDADKVYGARVTSVTSAQPTPSETVRITAVKNGEAMTLNLAGDTGADPVKLANKALSKLDS